MSVVMAQTSDTVRQTLLQHGLDMNGTFQRQMTWESPVKINHSVSVLEVEFGAYSYVAPYTELNYVSVGRYCSIGPHCRLFGSAHPTQWLSTHPFTHQSMFGHSVDYEPSLAFEGYSKATNIGHDVWIGVNAIIRPGVRIGHGAIVGAGAVVAKDVPDYAVVVGNPGKVIKHRFSEKVIERMLKVQWWRFDMPRHMADRRDLPFDQPEAMLDYIEEHGESLPAFSGVRKQLRNAPEGLTIRTLHPPGA
jgi:acetyltransferase-like isoleucine patch superfamily enzyme